MVIECGLCVYITKLHGHRPCYKVIPTKQDPIWKLTTHLLNKEFPTFHIHQQILQELFLASHWPRIRFETPTNCEYEPNRHWEMLREYCSASSIDGYLATLDQVGV